ncbi:DUF4298 domain-containing protein [Lawsonella clevelandensis]|uniref:DUF4298 domain-containing protein n=1 Tax=Lawsonella clevelandensis TaxID=1528099 RepID=A0A5E3ZXK1_9ACTN|nr:DUF4298 domain-containing protein [Lawsonella clevelandensis]MDU7193043.1 DUF4298 domain-containing protein [Lawsonella clevelandensis]VHO00716.1 hypothetical protein LC603019_00955 [Lawsonella clevelandensis]
MDDKKLLARIEEMESILNRLTTLLSEADGLLTEVEGAVPSYEKIKEYYCGPLQREDVEAYDAGKIPPDVPCGILSEDAIYDLFFEYQNTAIRMLELATTMVKTA